jgi:poly(rC)-binding protein 2/3/4
VLVSHLSFLLFVFFSRMAVPLVTRSTLEVVLPEAVVPKLVTKSRNKLAQISEWSGASVTIVEDRPEETQNIIRISGTPEQAERAQSLLQGFILSSKFLSFQTFISVLY